MSEYIYVVGEKNTLYFCSLDGKHNHQIGTLTFDNENIEDSHSITLLPTIGSVKLQYQKQKFLAALDKSVPLDTFFSQSINYKLTNSFTKTVLINGLLTIPCPYVDHRNIFPSVQELIDVLKHRHNANFFAIIPIEDEQYKVFIFEKV